MKPEYNLIPEKNPVLKKIYRIIYFSETPGGKLFDIFLLFCILLSTVLIMLETVPVLNQKHHLLFYSLEFVITILFTIEYILRIVCVKDREEYIFSPLGILDLLSILPFYMGLFFPAMHYFIILRMLRMLRIFRIFNLADYMHDGQYILTALRQSSRKIYIFLLFLCIFIVIVGSLMYVVEDGKNGFTSIPQSVYWAVVTITTVGYGDISPVTPIGKMLSIVLMLCGYSIIAVPTGIVTSELRHHGKNFKENCKRCGNVEVDHDARYCKKCGEKLV